MAALFGGELLDTIGVRGIWFPFGIGVSRTQYILRDCHPAPGLFDRTNFAFQRKRIDRRCGDVAQLISRYRGAR